MAVYRVDPLKDPRWGVFLERHPCASVFHTPAWLEALRRTYGYEPIVYTTSPPEAGLQNGLVFCRVKSWLTGRRLVSLPFSDHCEPLFDSAEELDFLVRYLQSELKQEEWKYIEVRPINCNFFRNSEESGFRATKAYCLHRLDLQPDLDELFRNLDKDSAQRRIQRAERACIIEKCGTGEALLKDFYDLLVLTRARHYVPPQPYEWFRNLIDCLGDALEMRVAYKKEIPIAAILTLRFKDTIYYKYGCSDARYHSLGAVPFLLWRTIQDAKSTGAKEFDLCRSDEGNPGLISFKNNWTHEIKPLVYWRYPALVPLSSREPWKVRMMKRCLAHMPKGMLTAAGRAIYRHIG